MSPNPQMQAAKSVMAPKTEKAPKQAQNNQQQKSAERREKHAEKSEHQGTIEYEMGKAPPTLLTEQEKLDQAFSEDEEQQKEYGQDKLPERLRKDSDIRDKLKNASHCDKHKGDEKHHERKQNRADLKHDVQTAPMDIGAESGGHKSHAKSSHKMSTTKPDQSRSQKAKDRTLDRQEGRDAKMADAM